MGYRIKTVSTLTGVPRNTLLAWERRYAVVQPHRQDNGYREYSEADVHVLREVKRMVDQGHKVSEAISLFQQAQQRLVPSDSHGGPTPQLAQVGQDLQHALVHYDRVAADHIVQRLSGFSFRELINDLYFPLLRRVGEQWALGVLSIPQEHYTSQYVREQLVSMLLAAQSGPSAGLHTICAGFPGERHDLAILGIAVQLAMQGRRVTLLGADVPTADIAKMAKSQRPNMVCISVMQPRETTEIADYLQQLRQAAPASCRVVLGGRGLPKVLPEIIGVELYRDGRALLGG